MKEKLIPVKLIITVLFIFELSYSENISAQSVWYGREKANLIALEINKPVTPSINAGRHTIPGLSPGSGSIFLSGRYSLKKNKNITFVSDIPLSHGYLDDTTNLNGSEWAFGNPYIGAEFDITESPVYFQLGLRLPLAPYDQGLAEFAGSVSDLDRSEAFLAHVFPIYGAVNFETVSDNKILFMARTGLDIWFNNDTLRIQSNPSVRFDYAVQTGYLDKNLNVILSLVGRKDLSSNELVTEKINIIQYGLSIVVPYKKIRPALSFRFPGNSETDNVFNFVIGLNFGYVF
ncbi:MAG TPA: hypothetical protein PKC91_08465 [Ignavibacteria bacterium]|nr:hypothetical protein [Ignavibacteria bacterium]